MRSFAKTFRAVLALCLVFSIVMSFVAVSADAVALSQVSVADQPQLIEGKMLYEVKYNVTGVSAGSASILVHDASDVASISNESIEYVGQKAPTAGTAEFTMLLEKGDYTVIGGGTGMAFDSEPLSLDAAPVFAAEKLEGTLLDNDVAGIAYPTAVDADGDEVAYTLEGEAAANFAISGANIVINAEGTLAEGTYTFTLVATAGGKTASIPVAITIESSIITIENVVASKNAFGVDYNTPEADVLAELAKVTFTTTPAVAVTASWEIKEGAYAPTTPGTYTYVGTLTAPENYVFAAGKDKVEVAVTVAERVLTPIASFDNAPAETKEVSYKEEHGLPAVLTSGAAEVAVTWTGEYKADTLDTYELTAVFGKCTDGYVVTAAAPVVKVTVKAIAVTAEYEAVNKSVAWGTALKDANLAAEIVLADGVVGTVAWTSETYNAEVAGTYAVVGTVTAPYGYALAENTIADTVTIEAKVIDKLDALKAIDVDWGTTLEAVKDLLPAQVTSGADVFDVEDWECKDGYEATEGSYIFTATLVEKAGYNVTAVATVVVNVGEEPVEDVKAFDPVAPIAVAWGTAEKAIEFPAVTYGGVEFEATWACADYNANKAGEYTFTATVADKDGYNIKDAAELTVVVTVGQKVFAATEGEYTLNEDYFVEGTVNGDAVYVGGDAVVTITGGNYNGGYTPFGGAGNTAVFAYGNAVVNITGGNFTIGGLARNEEGVLDKGQIDMIYAKENATINISGGTFKGADETVWLVNVKNDAYDAGTAKIVITGGTFINWDPTNGNGRGENYIADGYTVKATTVGTETHYTVVEKTAVDTIDPITVFVMPGDLYEDVIATVPTEITSGEVEITNIVWPEVIGETWPPVGEAALNVEAEDFDYNENDVTLAEDAVPSINFVTIPDTFDLKVDGLERDYLISDLDKAVAVEVGYNGPAAAGTVAFYYAIVDHASGTEIVAKEALPSDGVITYYATAAKGDSTDLIIYGTVGGKDLISKTVTVLKANGLFDGAIYNNATAANPEYSALRVNKNRDYTVSFAFTGRNGEFDFSAGKFVIEVVDTNLRGEVAGTNAANGSGSYTFETSELAEVTDGAYTVKVTYYEDETEVYSKERNVNITNRGFWYTEFTVNNGTSLAVKSVGMDATIKFDSTNAEGNVYAGFKLLPYGDELTNDGTGTELINGNEYNKKINVADKPVAAYSLYALANMTESQDFYDFAFGKTVYVRNSFTNLSGILVNGEMTITPDIDGNDGNLTIAPNWGGRKPSGDVEVYWTIKITHRYTGEDVILTEDNVEGATIEEDGTLKVMVDPSNVDKGLTIKAAKSVLPAKVYYEVKAYVNDSLDKEVAKRTIYINVK